MCKQDKTISHCVPSFKLRKTMSYNLDLQPRDSSFRLSFIMMMMIDVSVFLVYSGYSSFVDTIGCNTFFQGWLIFSLFIGLFDVYEILSFNTSYPSSFSFIVCTYLNTHKHTQDGFFYPQIIKIFSCNFLLKFSKFCFSHMCLE